MRLAVKFFLAYSVVILVLAGIAAWSLREVGKLSVSDTAVPVLTDADALHSAASLREAVLTARRFDMRSLVFTDAEYVAASTAVTNRVRADLDTLRGLVTTQEQKNLIAKAAGRFEEYDESVIRARKLRDAGNVKAAEALLRRESPRIDRVVDDLDRLTALTRDVLDKRQIEATAALSRTRAEIEKLRSRTWQAVVTAMLIAVLAALAGTAVISIRMTRSLLRLSNATKAVAEGKFHEPLSVDRRDEIGQLAQSFNSMAVRLREMDELKERFYSTVSHELRSPLNAMQEAVRLIEEGPLTPKQERLLAIFKKGTGRLQRLVNEVLDLSQLSAGLLPVDRRSFPIEQAVRQAVDELTPQADQQRVALTYSIEPGAGTVIADCDRIVEVLVNLIGNALRFTPSGGSVEVRVAGSENAVTLEVRDTGIGIPAALLPTIFERFRQAHSGKGGTGLGLAIVKSLVEAHGGNVTAESQEGRGSTFTVLLPRDAAANTSHAAGQAVA